MCPTEWVAARALRFQMRRSRPRKGSRHEMTQDQIIGRRGLGVMISVALAVGLVGCNGSTSQNPQASAGGSNVNAGINAAYPNAMLGGDGSFARVVESGLRVCTTPEAPSNWQDSSGK